MPGEIRFRFKLREIIDDYIKQTGTTIDQLADQIGTSRQALYIHLSGGGFNITTARRYSEVLNKTIEEICADDYDTEATATINTAPKETQESGAGKQD